MFTPGEVYTRRDLHRRFGGQRQSGISTPARHPIVLLFTGHSGEQYGYRDGFQQDGTFWYTGEGQTDDMEMVRGNRAIQDHAANGRALHLFEQVARGQVSYVGEFVCAGSHLAPAPDRDGENRNAIVFELTLGTPPAGGRVADVTIPSPHGDRRLWNEPLDVLRRKALAEAPASATPRQRKANAYERSAAVRIYVLKRANGICDACNRPAPFLRKDGRPYLEPHHVLRRADGGPDHPRWVAAVCPNCHREVHSGAGGADLNARIATRLQSLEPEL